MNRYCACTETHPNFVGALLLVPGDRNSPPGKRFKLWLCHDCFEQHVCEGYSLSVVADATYQANFFILEAEE